MKHTDEQMARFNAYKLEILNLQSVGDYVRQNISWRIRTHSPDELPDDLKLELDSIATETVRELRRHGLTA